MAEPTLALLRFDFVLGDDDESVVDELERRFGDPVEEAMWGDAPGTGPGERTYDVGGPAGLGLPEEFDAVAVRVVGFADAVTGVVTFASVDPGRSSVAGSADGDGVDLVRIREWERRLASVRSLVPGPERGPETTVFWVRTDPPPGEPPARPSTPAGARPSAADDWLHGAFEPFGDRSRGSLRLPGDGTLLLPRDPGQPWGTLLAVDLGDHLRSTVASGGRRLHGPWSDLAALYAVDYWARARGAALAAFEDRLSAEAETLPAAIGDVDPDEFGALDATLLALADDWSDLRRRVDGERRRLRRLLDDRAAGLGGGSRPTVDADGDDGAMLASYLDRLECDLERVGSDVGRIDDRLDALTAAFRTRASLVATRATVEVGRRLREWTRQRRALEDRRRWLVVAAASLAAVVVADAAMTGGLETFVDRLFDRGLGAFTTQVVTGAALLGVAVAALLLRRRRGERSR